jgi:hypothetical protein
MVVTKVCRSMCGCMRGSRTPAWSARCRSRRVAAWGPSGGRCGGRRVPGRMRRPRRAETPAQTEPGAGRSAPFSSRDAGNAPGETATPAFLAPVDQGLGAYLRLQPEPLVLAADSTPTDPACSRRDGRLLEFGGTGGLATGAVGGCSSVPCRAGRTSPTSCARGCRRPQFCLALSTSSGRRTAIGWWHHGRRVANRQPAGDHLARWWR